MFIRRTAIPSALLFTGLFAVACSGGPEDQGITPTPDAGGGSGGAGVDAGNGDSGDGDAGDDIDAGDIDAGDIDAGDIDAGDTDAGGDIDAGGDTDAGDGDEPGPPSEGGELVEGNPTCEDLGYVTALKLDPPESGLYGVGDDSIEFFIDDGYYFDWESTFPIDAIIAKSTPAAVYWPYDPGAFADEDMHGPTHPDSHPDAGEPYELGHVIFCELE